MDKNQKELPDNSFHLGNINKTVKIGGWEIESETNKVRWTKETFDLHELDYDYTPNLSEALDFIHPKDRRKLSYAIQKSIKDAEPYDLIVRLITATGKVRWIRTISYPQKERGVVTKLIGTVQDVTDIKEIPEYSDKTLIQTKEKNKELESLLEAAKKVLEGDNFQTTARNIFDSAKEIIGAQSGYVALLNENGDENEVLFLDAGGLPCTVDPYLPMPIRGLRETAYKTNKPAYDNDFMNSEWVKYMPAGHVELKNVLFAPLIIDNKAVGLIGLANKNEKFNDNDAKIAEAYAHLAAIALNNSHNFDRIKQNEQRLNQAQRLAKLGDFTWDIPTGNVRWSKTLYEILGYRENETIDFKHINDEIHLHEDKPKIEAWLFDNINSGSDYLPPLEYRIVKKNGSVINVRTLGIIEKENGKPIKIFATIQDITELKETEQTLKEFKNKIEAAMLAGSIAWWEMDIETGIVQFDSKKVMMLGYPPEKFENYRDFTNLLHADDYETAMTAMRNCLNGISNKYDTEYRIKCNNGQYKWFHDIGGITQWNKNGKPLSVTGMVLDITERKRAQESLIESEDKFKNLAENTSDLIILHDYDGSFLYISPQIEKFTGYTAEEYIELDTYANIVPQDRKKVSDSMKDIHYGANSSSVQYRLYKKNGDIIWLESRSNVIRFDNGQIKNIITASSDITQTKFAERQLLEKNEQLRAFAAHTEKIREEERNRIARELHDEMAQILSALNMNMSLINNNILTKDKIYDMEEISNEIDTMQHYVSETIGKVRSIVKELRMAELEDLNIMDAIELLIKEFDKNSGFEIKYNINIDNINISKKKSVTIYRIIQESLTNTIKHSMADLVEINLQTLDGIIELTVKDNGIGFNSDKISQKGFGILGMQERAALSNAKLEIKSKEHAGTVVNLSIEKDD